jgi:hypothetical protein
VVHTDKTILKVNIIKTGTTIVTEVSKQDRKPVMIKQKNPIHKKKVAGTFCIIFKINMIIWFLKHGKITHSAN